MRKFLITCLLVLFSGTLCAQAESHFPKTGRMVNDYSGKLSDNQRDILEQRLRTFSDSTSNQVFIIITPTLYGEEIKALGTQIGHDWGVGQKSLDNGLIIIIKSKTTDEPDGEVAIVTGYGLEGVLPDAFCKYIIDEKMVSHLAEDEYYEALVASLDIIEPTCRGEYSYAKAQEEDTRDAIYGGIILVVVIGAIILIERKIRKDKPYAGNDSYYSSNSSSSSSSSNSSSYSDSDYSSSCDYGGGDFGGGGASSRF